MPSDRLTTAKKRIEADELLDRAAEIADTLLYDLKANEVNLDEPEPAENPYALASKISDRAEDFLLELSILRPEMSSMLSVAKDLAEMSIELYETMPDETQAKQLRAWLKSAKKLAKLTNELADVMPNEDDEPPVAELRKVVNHYWHDATLPPAPGTDTWIARQLASLERAELGMAMRTVAEWLDEVASR